MKELFVLALRHEDVTSVTRAIVCERKLKTVKRGVFSEETWR